MWVHTTRGDAYLHLYRAGKSLCTLDLVMMNSRGRWAVALTFIGCFGITAIQCSSSDSGGESNVNPGAGGGEGKYDTTPSNTSTVDAGSLGADAQTNYDPEAFFATDPPPADCSSTGAQPSVPGGTPECPDDKNLKGCPCPYAGATAPCWPGKRKHRNKGMCQDGVTTCQQSGEFGTTWGECEGYQGISAPTFEPAPGAEGKAACTCFSGGYWELANTSPCFYSNQNGQVIGAVSTIPDGAGARCPTQQEVDFKVNKKPSAPFSSNTLQVDCNGFFKLCFTLRALAAPGAPQNPASDCTVSTVCAESHYGLAGQGPNGSDGVMDMPMLPSWMTTNASEIACADNFYRNGGYGELSVDGTSDECDKVNKVFQRFDYCPILCNDPANKGLAQCANCSNGTGAPF